MGYADVRGATERWLDVSEMRADLERKFLAAGIELKTAAAVVAGMIVPEDFKPPPTGEASFFAWVRDERRGSPGVEVCVEVVVFCNGAREVKIRKERKP